MEQSDATPRQPACQFDRRIPDPSADDLLAIEWAINMHRPLGAGRVEGLYNAYLRALQVIVLLEQCLGPASDDIMDGIYKEVL